MLDLAEPVLKHRMALTFSARAEGETVTGIIASSNVPDQIVNTISDLCVAAGNDEATWQKFRVAGSEQKPIGRTPAPLISGEVSTCAMNPSPRLKTLDVYDVNEDVVERGTYGGSK